MFDNLNKRLSGVFANLRKKGALTEADIDAAMREVRIALLEADVALPVVKEFTASLKEAAVGQEIVAAVSPAQMVIKLVHDHLAVLLGAEHQELNLAANPPVVLMMVGLQGSGKTTSSGKLALRLREKENRKVIVASLDTQRPAAQEQLAVVAKQAGVESLPIVSGQSPVEIARRAMDEARKGGFDVLILDTAGRLHIDESLMGELQQIKEIARPLETLLVADSLTGQDAVNIAREFHEKIVVTGIILTRVDGDARGGAALSMRQVTGQPIKFLGVGEKLTALEPFHPSRIAGRILDMGDIVSFVEKAAEAVDQAEAEAMTKRLSAGQFDLNDLLAQFRNMKKMGGLSGVMKMMPGMGALKEKMENAQIDEGAMARQEAIILAMTPNERAHPKLLNASRKRRIAAGSGTDVADINRLLKQYQQMEKVTKMMKKMGRKGMSRGGLQQMLQGLR